ncbi:MAG: hypothetical protein MUC95_10220 [Spirochaetes bacterium]|nr:hypothetical protein [Spirochaetota bacterium]
MHVICGVREVTRDFLPIICMQESGTSTISASRKTSLPRTISFALLKVMSYPARFVLKNVSRCESASLIELP